MYMKTDDYEIINNVLVWINPELKELTIPEGVKIVNFRDLNDYSFYLRKEQCAPNIYDKLEKITFPYTLEVVYEDAFLNCKGLSKIVVKNLTAKYSYAFSSNSELNELTFEIQSEDGFAWFDCSNKDSYKGFPIPHTIKYLFKNDKDILIYFFCENTTFIQAFDAINHLNKNCLINFEVANESGDNDVSVCNILNTLYKKCDYSFPVFRNIIQFLCAHSESLYTHSYSYDEKEECYIEDEDYYKCVKKDLLNVLNNLEKKVHVSETIVSIFSHSYDSKYNIIDDDSNFMHLTKYFEENKYYNKNSDIKNEFKKVMNDVCLRSLYDMLYTSKDSSEILKEFVLVVKDVYNQIDNKIIEGIKSNGKKREMIIDKIITKRSEI